MSLYLKQATMTPLLKIYWLDKDIKNYRHMSNLPFISKRIEKVAARRIGEHLEHNDINDSYQSAYRRGHSTETVLMKVHRDIAEALGGGSMIALIMLDLSAAFDVIYHAILEFRIILWIQTKGLSLSKVVPRRQNSEFFTGG